MRLQKLFFNLFSLFFLDNCCILNLCFYICEPITDKTSKKTHYEHNYLQSRTKRKIQRF